MCNARTSSNDQTLKPRITRGGHIWINLFGRDWVVRRRRPTLLGVIGTAIGGLGVIGLMWGSLVSFKPDRVGVALLVVGAIIVCYQGLRSKNLAADEIYKIGYDRGREDGYDEGYEDRGLEHPAAPVVVPLRQRCAECGATAGVAAVGSVADRV